jgi:hypothetical protein
MPQYKYLGKIYNSRRELKEQTGFSSCKVDAKILENKIIKIEGKSNENIYYNTKQHSK